MPKPKVDPAVKRIIISARVKPEGKATLLAIGEGNISLGLDRIMNQWQAGQPDVTNQPTACGVSPASPSAQPALA
jgi:hypothetical protein